MVRFWVAFGTASILCKLKEAVTLPPDGEVAAWASSTANSAADVDGEQEGLKKLTSTCMPKSIIAAGIVHDNLHCHVGP
jgi:hypothetical protein